MKRTSTRQLCEAGVIAALYAALTLLLQPLSFGPFQVRPAEALTILPTVTSAAIPGLTVGCAVANALCVAANPAGAWDILFGSAATLAAAGLTYALRHSRFRGLPLLASLPPVVLNAVVVGTELAVVYLGFSWQSVALCMLQVAAGELIAAVGGGLLLWRLLPRNWLKT